MVGGYTLYTHISKTFVEPVAVAEILCARTACDRRCRTGGTNPTRPTGTSHAGSLWSLTRRPRPAPLRPRTLVAQRLGNCRWRAGVKLGPAGYRGRQDCRRYRHPGQPGRHDAPPPTVSRKTPGLSRSTRRRCDLVEVPLSPPRKRRRRSDISTVYFATFGDKRDMKAREMKTPERAPGWWRNGRPQAKHLSNRFRSKTEKHIGLKPRTACFRSWILEPACYPRSARYFIAHFS